MLSIGIDAEVDEREREADRETGEARGAALRVRDTEDHEQEDRGEEDLGDDRGAEPEAAGGEVAEAVARETAVLRGREPAVGAEQADQHDERRADRATDDLGDDVARARPSRRSARRPRGRG